MTSGNSNRVRVVAWTEADIVKAPIQSAIENVPDIEVVNISDKGMNVVNAVRKGAADIVIIDIGMKSQTPRTAIDRLRTASSDIPIVMVGTLSFGNVQASMNCLMRGAAEFVPVPTKHAASHDQKSFAEALLRVVRALGKSAEASGAKTTSGPLSTAAPAKSFRPTCLLIGSSTGGPHAVSDVLAALGQNFRLPILITQHMPAGFTGLFAENLTKKSGMTVTEGVDGETIVSRHAYVAPGGKHMEIVSKNGKQSIRLSDAPPINFCKPAVDPMFKTAAEAFRGNVLAIVLTGMGSDGAQGATEIGRAGGYVIAQDKETSVVWGMPGAVAEAGAAHEILPLGDIAKRILALTGS